MPMSVDNHRIFVKILLEFYVVTRTRIQNFFYGFFDTARAFFISLKNLIRFQ